MGVHDLLRTELTGLTPYHPDATEVPVRLDANEAPPLLSAAARARLASAAAESPWHRYPDATQTELRRAIAAWADVSPDEVVPGAGSDEVITFLLTAFSRPRSRGAPTVVTSTPTFGMYRMGARLRGFRVLEVPLTRDWRHDVPGLLRAIEVGEPHLVFLASPNNPTGTRLDRDEVARLAAAAPETVIVLDEAYVDYADASCLSLYREHPNVVVMRTLSKIGLASLRLGWLVAAWGLAAEVDKVRQPFNLSSQTQRVATVALTELAGELASTVAFVRQERARVHAALAEFPGVEVTPSEANFLWFRAPKPSSEVFERLRAQGVLVRSFHPAAGRLAHQLRVTMGTAEENDAFLERLAGILA